MASVGKVISPYLLKTPLPVVLGMYICTYLFKQIATSVCVTVCDGCCKLQRLFEVAKMDTINLIVTYTGFSYLLYKFIVQVFLWCATVYRHKYNAPYGVAEMLHGVPSFLNGLLKSRKVDTPKLGRVDFTIDKFIIGGGVSNFGHTDFTLNKFMEGKGCMFK